MAAAPFPRLFSPITIGKAAIRNRIVSTGHDTGMSAGGHVTDQLVAYHRARAAGGTGLIVTQVMGVHDTARYSSHILMIHEDGFIPGLRRLAEAIHAEGGTVFGQLFHPGREIMEGQDGTIPPAYAPSAVPNERFHVTPVPLSRPMIGELVAAYAAGARRMREAGYDGCEIVASHGYLPAQFLNPRVNRRVDDYGGPLANRLRFLTEVVAAVRDAVGGDLAIGVRISGEDKDADAIAPADVIEACRLLGAMAGAPDYFNVIAGSSATIQGAIHIVPPMTVATGYVAPLAAAVKAVVTQPVIVGGRINQPQIAEGILASGQADLCGMTRALIADPRMPAKAKAGRSDDIRACIACNQACIGHFHKGYTISCIQHPETGREAAFGAKTKAARRKRVLVAGGGPGGLKAAAVLAERGHDVTLYEAKRELGGQVLLAQLLPHRSEFGGLATNLIRECEIAGVKIVKRTAVDRALVERERPDAVVIATGARPRQPDFEGRESMHTLDAWQVLRNEANPGGSVIIADWRSDWIGIGLAEKLAAEGRRVRLCVDGIMAGEHLPWYVRDSAMGRLHGLGVEVIPYARLFGADGDTVYFQHASSGAPIVLEGVDTLVLSQGHERVSSLTDALESWPGEIRIIGDALTPRTAEEAVLEGLKAGCGI